MIPAPGVEDQELSVAAEGTGVNNPAITRCCDLRARSGFGSVCRGPAPDDCAQRRWLCGASPVRQGRRLTFPPAPAVRAPPHRAALRCAAIGARLRGVPATRAGYAVPRAAAPPAP